MQSVPCPRPPHLHRQVSRHGKPCWYVRINKGKRIRIRAPFGTPEFDSEYQAAITGAARPTVTAPSVSTLTWLIDRYRESAAWASLSPATRRQREGIFVNVLKTAGTTPFARITFTAINAGLERRTPIQAHHFLYTMRGLFRWALKNNHVRLDPTAGVEKPQHKATDGFLPWTESMVEAYERRWPIGTRQRVWLDVLLYTGLRVGDAYRLGKQHVRAGQIKTEKTGQTVPIQILPVLATTLAAGPCGDLTFIVGGNGRSFISKGAFGNAFIRAAKAAGVPGTAHGIRKLAATRAANAGATEAQLEAIFGWRGGKMASFYTLGQLTASGSRKRRYTSLPQNKNRKSIPPP
jgi:integrase